MPFVQRDNAGAIVARFANPQPGFAEEWVDDGHPDLLPSKKQVIAEQWEKIKAERDRRRFEGGVKVGDHWFLSTEVATGEYNSMINLGLPGDHVLRSNWRTMDGAEVPMTPDLAKQILAAGFAQAAAVDDAAVAHRIAMAADENPVEYNFSAGWPQTYAEFKAAQEAAQA